LGPCDANWPKLARKREQEAIAGSNARMTDGGFDGGEAQKATTKAKRESEWVAAGHDLHIRCFEFITDAHEGYFHTVTDKQGSEASTLHAPKSRAE
jgi:hypothetical protein